MDIFGDNEFFANAEIVEAPKKWSHPDDFSSDFWQSGVTRIGSPIDGKDPRWASWNKTLEKPFDFSTFDTIQATAEEISEMSQIDIDPILELVEKPALLEFTLKVMHPNEDRSICFRETTLPKSGIICKDETDDKFKTVFPIIDAYISLNGGKTVDWVVNIGYCAEGNEIATFNWPIWARNHSSYSHPMMSRITSEVNAYYWLLQRVLHDRPTAFVKTSIRRTDSGKKRKKSDKRRSVKTVKVIRIKLDDLRDYCEEEKVKREITCPSWGVIGHWRTYKSGKRVWIKPYRKGQYRHNPKVYDAKDYEVVTEEE